MMRTCALVLVFLCCYAVGHSQAKVTIGSPYGVIDAQQKYYFPKNGQILTVKMQKRNVMLQKLDAKTLKFLQIRTYDDLPKDIVVEKVMEFNDKFYLFYSLYEEKTEQLFVREIDFKNGTFKGMGKRIISVEEKLSGTLVKTGFMSAGVADKFDFYASFDSSSLIIKYRLVPETKRDSKSYDVIGMHVFDKDLNEKWGNKVTMPYTEKKMDNLDYSVDASGNVYIVARVYNDDTTDKKRGDDVNYSIEIMKVAAKTGSITSTKVNIADKFVKTVWLYETAQNTMIGAGYYNKGNKPGNVDGVCFFKVRNDGLASDMKTYEIPVEILNQYASRKEKRKNEKREDDDEAEITNLILRDVKVQADGSILLIGEQSYMVTRTSYVNGRSSYYVVYYYNDMLVTKIDPAGKLAWMRKLAKRQRGAVDGGGMSYAYIGGKNAHYLVYLDNVKNADLPIDEEPATHVDGQGGFLTAYKVNDKTGEVKKITVLDTRNVEDFALHQFQTSRVMNTSLNTLVFESYKKKKEDILIKAEFE